MKINNIFITGLTSLRLNALELENLGNYVIIEPFFESLRAHYPDSNVTTTLQLTEEFCQRYNIKTLRDKKYWTYNVKYTLIALFELLFASLWSLFNKFGIRVNKFLVTERLKEIERSNVIIDFSGDMFGDNALNNSHFLTGGVIVPYMCKLLGKKMYLIASSPGPFSSGYKHVFAKKVLKLYDIVATREPISTMILNGMGLTGEKYITVPCFSFGFRPMLLLEKDIGIKEKQLLKGNKPIIGLILSNLNMTSGEPKQWPRNEQDFNALIELVNYLVTNLSANVCIFSHRHQVNKEGQLERGLDHKIVNELVELLPQETKSDVYTLNGLYDAATLNQLIGNFDMLISGRIHGAIQGISQSIPTVIIDYGMEPKAHKLKGLALLSGLYDYVCDPKDAQAMKEISGRMWANREDIRKELDDRVPKLIKQSENIWEMIQDDYKK